MVIFEHLFLLPFLLALVVAFASVPLTIRLAWKFGLIDDPKKHKHPKVIHTHPIPRAGGLAIFLGIAVASLAIIEIDKHLFGILLGAIVLLVVGLLDDKFDLNPYLRLGAQFAAASMPIAAGIGIAFINHPLSTEIIDLSQPRLVFSLFGTERSIWVLSALFGLVWIVALMNFLNMGAKGVDGQLPGVAGIAAITIGLLSYRFSADITEWPVTILAAITAGAFFGFLPWNAYPQKIMPGFSGSSLAGYFLGVLSILSTSKVGVLAIVLAVPLVDTTYTILRRVHSGRSPVWGDRGHLHHRLMDSGVERKHIAPIYWMASATLGVAALFLNSEHKLYTIVGIALIVGGLILWLKQRQK